MQKNRFTTLIGTAALGVIGGSISAGPAVAPDNLPQADPVFHGKINQTYYDSKADIGLFASPKAPEGAPNILLILIDDAGFGATSTFGGPCHTPTLDRLAREGLRYNNFHTTSLCSPTRAALLTGHNHHSAATGIVCEFGTGFPGYTGIIPRSTATIAQILQDNGYSTAWVGKNHNLPNNMYNNVGPFSRWPNHLGFDYFYGFIGGMMDQWYPTIYENQNPVQAWGTPEEGYNLGIDITDKAIAWMQNLKAIAPDRPFFLYYAPGATHSPHQPPEEWGEKYKGKFSMGYDKIRESIFKRQKELGVIPQNAKLTERMEGLPSWDSFSDEERKLLEREMEVYAGYYEFTDHQIGRVIDAIEEMGQLDNTLIIFIAGDNGASAEGTFIGIAQEMVSLDGLTLTLEQNMKYYDDWGGPGTAPHYAAGWAWAMDTPFRWTKQVASYLGGVRNPMVISWPAKIKDKGGLRPQFGHVNDIAPTILDIVGIEQPDKFNGIEQKPMEGVSLSYTFADDAADAPSKKKTQYFEMLGNRGVYHDGWMASTLHRIPWEAATPTTPFDDDKWELHNLAEDFSQAKADNLADKYPEKLKEMQGLFDKEAKKYNVYPLDDRWGPRAAIPNWTSGRKHFVFHEGMIRLPDATAPTMINTSFSITADVVIPENGAEGVLLAMGGGSAGFVLYIKDNKFIFQYSTFSYYRYFVKSNDLPTGKVQLKLDFKYDGGGTGKGGTATLLVNGKKVSEGRLEHTVPGRFSLDDMDIGMDLSAPVGNDYKPPFKFTGKIEKVTIDLK